MTHNKHLEEVDPSTLSTEELRERLTWRDEHPAEVIRAEREREAQRRLDQKMQNARDGFLLAGGDAKERLRCARHLPGAAAFAAGDDR